MTDQATSQPPSSASVVIPTSFGRLHPMLAAKDLATAWWDWRLWGMLGWQDIRQRYRRSTLGPFWLTLSMGIMVGSIGGVYAVLFHQKLNDYLPFVGLGFILWGFISGILIDGCETFVGADAIIKQSRLPLSLHVFRIVWRQIIIFGHNFVIYLVVVVAFQVWPSWNTLLIFPAIVLWLINAFWLTMVLGIICARYRDIPPIITSVMQLAFLVTPIIWRANLMAGRAVLVNANPLYHFIEILRDPLLGQAPDMLSWYVSAGCTAAGCLITFELFRRYRWRIAYWL